MPKHSVYKGDWTSSKTSGKENNVIFFTGTNNIWAQGTLFGGYITGSTICLPSKEGASNTSLTVALSDHTHSFNSLKLSKFIASDSWSTDNLGISSNGFEFKVLRLNTSVGLAQIYGCGLAGSGADTHFAMIMDYNHPAVTFAGGNGTTMVWSCRLTGSNGVVYNLDNFASKSDLDNVATLIDKINGTVV